MKSWFAIDGGLDPIDYPGPSDYRYPLELARIVIERYSAPGAWVLDPFAGFGTTLVAAQALGRNAIGFEIDAERAAFAAGRVPPPSRLIHADARRIADHDLPVFDLVLTSPPYGSFRDPDNRNDDFWPGDLRFIFAAIRPCLKTGATVVVEVSNVRAEGRVLPRAWDAARALSTLFRFEGEVVRCNTGAQPTGQGYDHSYLLVFTNA